MRRTVLVTSLLTAALVTGGTAPAATPSAATPARAARATPIHAVFYYPWFPQTWYDDQHFQPSLGRYSSSNRAVVGTHIDQMKSAGMQAAIASWWGQGEQHEARRLPILFRAAAARGFAITPYYEPEGQSADPSLAKVRDDLAYLGRYHARFPDSFLEVGGKPVVFVYNATNPSCADVDKWSDATDGFTTWYVSLKLFPGFEDCPTQPSTWHQYGPATAYLRHGRYYANASPGFFHHSESTPRLARNLKRFCWDLTRVETSPTRWKLVTSFNEWGEGTAVESAREWESASGRGRYVDLMRKVFKKGKRCGRP